ncbi:DMT family transporter [Lysinibacillus sp. CNPSo 3705]|uniref:DMT family transporter n=1 Tax=Lysinibacillus sp. CNPSo 3705 TaxID=3028148 RepID=UPI00104DABDD|nr:DMT family transporter [Lysinibacillus sp. CNPSo 3705]MDD1504100.1 DMT family transporter [Lysinibacillus sp. CNPSo 3705]
MLKTLDLKIISAHFITIIIWASAFPGIRVALMAYSPEHISLLRLLIGSFVLIIIAVIRKTPLPELKDIPIILLLGFLGFTVYQVALNYGEQTISAGVASLLVSTTPIITALLAVFFYREKLSLWGWVGSLVGFCGVAFISIGGSSESFTFNTGIVIVLVASLSESIYFVFQHRYLEKYGAIPFTMYAIWSGTIFMLLFSPGLSKAIMDAPLNATLVILYLGIFPTIIPYFTLAYVTSRTGAAEATSTLYLTTVFAFLIAWIWLGEVPHFSAITGGLITLIGVFIANIKKEDIHRENNNAQSLN